MGEPNTTRDFEAVADELYGLRPDDFIAARDERVKEARSRGQKDLAHRIGRLRKPTASAWVVNLLARDQEGEIDQLLQLGEQLREAQGELTGDLRELSRRRTQVVSALAGEGRRLAREAGQPVSESVGREVEGTLEAALADPDTAATVRSGRLTTRVTYSGLGLVGVAGTADGSAAPEASTQTKPSARSRSAGQQPRTRPEFEKAQQHLTDAQQAAEQAEQSHTQAREYENDARSRKEAADEQVSQREAELDQARAAAAQAADELTDASRRREEAHQDVETAQEGVEQARSRVDRLRAD